MPYQMKLNAWVAAHGWKAQALLFSSLCIIYTWQHESNCFFLRNTCGNEVPGHGTYWSNRASSDGYPLKTRRNSLRITWTRNLSFRYVVCLPFSGLKQAFALFRKVPLIIFVSRSKWTHMIALKPSISMPMAIFWEIKAWYHYTAKFSSAQK